MPAAEIRHERIGLRAGALAVLATALWGGNSVSIKIGLTGLPPVAMAAARFALGTAVVALAARITGVSLGVAAGTRWRLLGLAALFTVQIVLLNVGTRYTSAGRSTVLICPYPFFTAVAAHWLIPHDRLTWRKGAGLALSFAGVVLVFYDALILARTASLPGDLMVLISGAMLGLRQVVTKRLVAGTHPFPVLFWQASLSIPAFAAISLLFERQASWAASGAVAAAVLYQGLVIAGFCFILMIFLLRRHSASRLGAFGFITPVVGVLLSALLLGEPLSPVLLASMALVAAGIVVVNRE